MCNISLLVWYVLQLPAAEHRWSMVGSLLPPDATFGLGTSGAQNGEEQDGVQGAQPASAVSAADDDNPFAGLAAHNRAMLQDPMHPVTLARQTTTGKWTDVAIKSTDDFEKFRRDWEQGRAGGYGQTSAFGSPRFRPVATPNGRTGTGGRVQPQARFQRGAAAQVSNYGPTRSASRFGNRYIPCEPSAVNAIFPDFLGHVVNEPPLKSGGGIELEKLFCFCLQCCSCCCAVLWFSHLSSMQSRHTVSFCFLVARIVGLPMSCSFRNPSTPYDRTPGHAVGRASRLSMPSALGAGAAAGRVGAGGSAVASPFPGASRTPSHMMNPRQRSEEVRVEPVQHRPRLGSSDFDDDATAQETPAQRRLRLQQQNAADRGVKRTPQLPSAALGGDADGSDERTPTTDRRTRQRTEPPPTDRRALWNAGVTPRYVPQPPASGWDDEEEEPPAPSARRTSAFGIPPRTSFSDTGRNLMDKLSKPTREVASLHWSVFI